MKRRLIIIFGNISLIAGLILSIYVLIDSYIIKSKLPQGVCPINQNKPLFYLAIGFLAISIVLSFFEKKKINEGTENNQ